MHTQHKGLARSLLTASLLTDGQLELALTQAQQEAKPLSTVLVERKLLSSHELAKFCVRHYDLPLFDLDTLTAQDLPPQYLSMDLIERHHALPILFQDNVLYLAISDPSNMQALEDFSFRFNVVTDAKLVEEIQLSSLLSQLQRSDEPSLIDLTHSSDDDADDLAGLQSSAAEETPHDQDDAPLVQYIHQVLRDAVRQAASDIHFEPYELFYRIRFRIDGILHDVASPPSHLANRFAARLKVMASLDIAERRLPQDGRIKLKLGRHKSIDMRVSSLPTQAGEKVVLRLLDSAITKLDINQLGFNEGQKSAYLEALHLSQGLILVTGPTGSGKTVSLYTGLSILNQVSSNISTAEDPIEIIMPGINQVQINPKAGLGFAQALRAFLRQDPDIIMVGEIRDLETAEIAIKAAQTGHLVLSTLHTNSATDTLTRLKNMGLAAYNIASSVSLIIAQRLARKLCPHCKIPEVLSAPQLALLGLSSKGLNGKGQDCHGPELNDRELNLFQASGCVLCTDGYKGRIGIYEVLPMNDTLAELMLSGADSLTLARAATASGMLTLRQAALAQVQQGIISLAEANRITQ
ncbi:type IV-A pilus assembly ATPase PilB [Oceanisphaera profunda]|uniref:Type IV-A pilus assembly ATPase PilB n=1 Tax=Oceanisphaera profunda TaxID=1416627 RepID=A0A1Y0D6Y2_9GAMM|nr:type IV-A pilus assembly ATPase PilB [Oceanisphaera profunda]ART82926.1 type IV-A pilus assembly ATPase PilB [Oceanisphaera profunda]